MQYYFFLATSWARQSSTRYARWLLIPLPSPSLSGAHVGNCVLCLLETARRQLRSPSLAQLCIPKAVVLGWGLSPGCAPSTNRARCSNQLGSPSSFGLSGQPLDNWDRSTGWTQWAGLPEENWSRPRADRNETESMWRSTLFQCRHEGGSCKWK